MTIVFPWYKPTATGCVATFSISWPNRSRTLPQQSPLTSSSPSFALSVLVGTENHRARLHGWAFRSQSDARDYLVRKYRAPCHRRIFFCHTLRSTTSAKYGLWRAMRRLSVFQNCSSSCGVCRRMRGHTACTVEVIAGSVWRTSRHCCGALTEDTWSWNRRGKNRGRCYHWANTHLQAPPQCGIVSYCLRP